MIRTRVLEFCRLRTKPLIHGTLLHMRKGSNLRPLVLETRALPTELLMYGGKRRTRPPVQLPRHPVFKTGRGSNATASLSMLWDLVDSNHSPEETEFTVRLPYPKRLSVPNQWSHLVSNQDLRIFSPTHRPSLL